MINYGILGYVILMHILDMFFTYKMIKKLGDRYENPELIEMNYHRYFMQKFGLKKGAIISVGFISLPILIIVTLIAQIYYFNIRWDMFIAGMTTTMAYVNYMSWVNDDEIKKNLIEKKQ